MRLAYTSLVFLIALPLTSYAVNNEDAQVVSNLLNEATSLENKGSNNDLWQAAKIYCEASKNGSVEAQYRLGILYAYGKGVPKNRAYAATLFSISSRQGHFEASNMLEIINFHAETLPPCLVTNIDPEHFLGSDYGFSNETAGIDRYIVQLPKDKRWALELASTTAEWHNVDPKLVISIIAIESGFNEQAKSNANAIGMMQLIPATAERFNVKNAFNAAQNIKGGVRYLRWLINYYQGDIVHVVAAYNAGEKVVDRYKGIPPYKETRDYVRKFKSLYQAKFHPYTNIEEISPLKK